MNGALLKSAALQWRVIRALMIRELHTRYGRENIGFLWVIGEPILFCAGVAVVWTAIRPAHEHGLPITAFVISGYVPLTMWRHCVGRSVKAFEANGSLLFHQQVSPLDIITARVILEIAGAVMAGLLVSVGAVIVGAMAPPANWGLLYLGLFYHMAFCYGCALLISSLSEKSDILEKVLSVITYLSLPLSGAFTMVDWAPKAWQPYLLWSPAVQDVEMIRAGMFGSSVHAQYDVWFDTWVIAIMLLFGLSQTLRVRRFILVH